MTVSSTFISADGDGYELSMGRWSRRLAPLFIDFAKPANGDRLLDVGCGTGNLTFELANTTAAEHIQGIDFSTAYIDHARRTNKDARLNFEVGDACNLAFPDATFDHSLSQLVLPFIPQAERAVHEMARVTKPGGVVSAAAWDNRGGFVVLRMFFDTAAAIDPGAEERRSRTLAKFMTRPGDLAKAWVNAGLKHIVQDEIAIRMEFLSFADFWAPAEGKDGPYAEYVNSLNVEARASFKEAMKRTYLDGDPDGERSYVATARVVKGVVP